MPGRDKDKERSGEDRRGSHLFSPAFIFNSAQLPCSALWSAAVQVARNLAEHWRARTCLPADTFKFAFTSECTNPWLMSQQGYRETYASLFSAIHNIISCYDRICRSYWDAEIPPLLSASRDSFSSQPLQLNRSENHKSYFEELGTWISNIHFSTWKFSSSASMPWMARLSPLCLTGSVILWRGACNYLEVVEAVEASLN